MELTLKRLLEQAKFTTTRKGYDQDEVDDFLDRAVAMATKVEARLTQALADANKGGPAGDAATTAAPERPEADIQAEIAAEVNKRLAAKLAEIEASAPKAAVVDDNVTAEEAARTLVLAQRTADAAISEARAEAEQLRARAREESEEERRSLAEQTEQERTEARGRLAREIHALEDARDGLRADVSTLEGHVEEQRVQLQSTVAELQRLLDDPAAFRLPPAPQSRQVDVPDLADATPPSAAIVAPSAQPDTPSETGDTDRSWADGETRGSTGTDSGSSDPGSSDPGPSDGDPSDGGVTTPVEPTGPTGEAEITMDFGDSESVDPEASLDAGPPTAPVSVVDLHLGSTDPVSVAGGQTGHAPTGPVEGDDAFLAELRKAMADEEPLGPRDVDLSGGQQGFLDDERRGWRFGRRR